MKWILKHFKILSYIAVFMFFLLAMSTIICVRQRNEGKSEYIGIIISLKIEGLPNENRVILTTDIGAQRICSPYAAIGDSVFKCNGYPYLILKRGTK